MRMITTDHYKTATWGNSASAVAARAAPKVLVDAGRPLVAFDQEALDINSKYSRKYSQDLTEARLYARSFLGWTK